MFLGTAMPMPVYPRVGGGNLMQALRVVADAGLSPRGRGKPPRACSRLSILRSIPAWAGETRSFKAAIRRTAVYPRVGGGNEQRAVGF